MNDKFALIQKWVSERSDREKIYIFLFGFLVLYLFFFIFFFHPLSNQKKLLNSTLTTLRAQHLTLLQQKEQIKQNIQMPVFLQMLQQYNKLNRELSQIDQQIEKFKVDLFSPGSLSSLSKQILQQPSSDSVLINLTELPTELWPSKEKAEKNNLLMNITPGYQHTLQMQLKNDYFSTIRYLANIEKLSKHIYWDSMEYKVVQYPNAEVIVRLHLLTLQKN